MATWYDQMLLNMIDVAEGPGLDDVGRMLGIERGKYTDAEYRTRWHTDVEYRTRLYRCLGGVEPSVREHAARAAQYPRADTEPMHQVAATKRQVGSHDWSAAWGAECAACGLKKLELPLPNGQLSKFYQWPGGIRYEKLPPCDPSRKPGRR